MQLKCNISVKNNINISVKFETEKTKWTDLLAHVEDAGAGLGQAGLQDGGGGEGGAGAAAALVLHGGDDAQFSVI